MLLLNPETVRFEDLLWEDASAIAIDREASRLIEEWSDLGPHLAFADAPERKTTIRVVRRLVADDRANDAAMHVGRTGTLVFYPSAERSDAARSRYTIHAMLASARTELGRAASSPAARPATPTQTLTFIALSPDDGASDPITIEDATVTD